MVNPKSLDNLRPFRKGQSGNPGGLPKGTPKIGLALVRFLSMPPRIFRNYSPRSVAEELAKRIIELAIDGPTTAAVRAFGEIADRTEGKPGRITYVQNPNGQIKMEYEVGWRPPVLVLERGDLFDDKDGVLYPAASFREEKHEVAS